MTDRNIPRVVRGRIELFVPSDKEEYRYIHPSAGPDTYQSVAKQILNQSLSLPHGNYTVPLLHAAYCSEAKDEEFGKIREMMKRRWLWVFNSVLWTPEGAYVVQDKEGKGMEKSLNINDLELRLKDATKIKEVRFSKDGSVRFAPKGSYALGDHTPKSLKKDGFVIASYGQTGAELLGEVSEKFRNSPYVYGLDIQESQSSKQRVSALGGYDGRLVVVGGFDYDDGGVAFPVHAPVAKNF